MIGLTLIYSYSCYSNLKQKIQFSEKGNTWLLHCIRAIKSNLLSYYSILKAARDCPSVHSSLIVLCCRGISVYSRWVLVDAFKLSSPGLYFGSCKFLWHIFSLIVEGRMKCWKENGLILHSDSFVHSGDRLVFEKVLVPYRLQLLKIHSAAFKKNLLTHLHEG